MTETPTTATTQPIAILAPVFMKTLPKRREDMRSVSRRSTAGGGGREALAVLLQYQEHRVVQVTVRRDDLVPPQVEGRAVETRDPARGLLDEQAPRHHVPGLEALLEEGVEAPGGDVAEVQGGRTVPPEPARLSRKTHEEPQAVLDVRVQVVGET